jgi:hypothetical protein
LNPDQSDVGVLLYILIYTQPQCDSASFLVPLFFDNRVGKTSYLGQQRYRWLELYAFSLMRSCEDNRNPDMYQWRCANLNISLLSLGTGTQEQNNTKK